MDTYSMLRAFADSWALLGLTLIFLAVFVWAWRPGSRATHDAIASSILRDDTKPAARRQHSQEASPCAPNK